MNVPLYITIFSSLFTGLIGLFVGNRLALGRDKRKEFNSIAEPLFETLERQRIVALDGHFPMTANETDQSTFILIKRKLNNYNRKKLETAVENFVQAKAQCGFFESGRYNFNKPEILISAIEDIQIYLSEK